MYDSFDILPILNWHNFLKSGDYAFFVINISDKKKYSEKQLIQNYEKLIDSSGERKLLNGYYAKCLQSFILFYIEKSAKTEQTYNNDFYAYLSVLSESVEEIIVSGKRFFNLREGYTHYYSVNGRQSALQNRIYDFHYNNFPDKKYDFDLFNDIATIENYLKRTIDPASTSVNHYNAIKKDAIRKAENERNNSKK